MKNKVLWTFSMVLFLLISCTFLSLRIEKLMMPQVIKIAPDFSKPTIDLDALFADETGVHLYRVGKGAGWEQGARTYELEANNYRITDGQIYLNQSGISVVHYSSKQPKDGEAINILETKEGQDDHWLVISSIELPPLANVLDDCTVLEQSKTALFLSALNAPSPFIQGRARSALFGKEIAFVDPNASQYAVYSINDIEAFLRQLPLLAILAGIFLFTILLWLFSFPYLKRPRKYREVLLMNGGLAAAILVAMPFLLGAIRLPASLLPQDCIFDFGQYSREFSKAFSALRSFAATGGSQAQSVGAAVFSTANSALTGSLAVMLCGIFLAAALAAVEAILLKRRAQSGQHFRRVKE